ncbi:LuxR C-terminal-related transcriptional regulator [Lacihabitans sp. LS3-19]|uniref:LuxR C-terminal-related transcriptional regulator n=1 Tax=Lacihabitans sp. LS3-19 TaxID=2487335 RepID=UPI0020CB744A|nr:LuxR C-terminal-related transcriptional regulator [Lacihabitans sp. LS3-19]
MKNKTLKSQYPNCGILFFSVFNILIINCLCFSCFAFGEPKPIEQKIKNDGLCMLAKDFNHKEFVKDVPFELFEVDNRPILNAGWGKFKAWLKVDLSKVKGEKNYMVVQNPVFDELRFYNKNGLAESFSFGKLLEDRKVKFRYPTYKIVNDSSIYLSGITKLNPAKFPIRFFDEKGFVSFKENEAFKNGILLGLLAFVILINVILFVLFKVRSFLIFIVSAACFGLLYCFLEGYLFGRNYSAFFFENSLFNFQYVIYGGFQLSSFWFFHSVFQQYMRPFKFLYTSFRFLVLLGIIETVFMFLSPFWFHNFSDYGIVALGMMLRVSTLILNILLFVVLFKIRKRTHLAIWFLLGLLPSWVVYILPRFIPVLFENTWFTMPQLYSLATQWYIVVISIGLLSIVYKNLKKEVIPEVVAIKNPEIKKSILSAREMDILVAFTNGFSYTEISDAMFISPHTVRTHIKNIYNKLEINSKSEAVRWVIEHQ